MRMFPALDVTWPRDPSEDEIDRILATVDAFDPTAVENCGRGVRIFFLSEVARDEARQGVTDADPHLTTTALLVPDENWAARSQASVTPIRVGRIIVTPPWAVDSVRQELAASSPAATSPDHDLTTSPVLVLTVLPSMGFGTGHHASTRLCLALLQRVPVEGRSVLDVGTGSGVLAMAAAQLGAARSMGIDYDLDALASAEENVGLNALEGRVELRVVDITREPASGTHDLLLGNLTGGMLVRHAPRLIAEVAPNGSIITSGFQTHERDEVVAAFAEAGARLMDEAQEDDWVAALFVCAPATTSPTGSKVR
jgi:ribosomal protein L11 methyltransferase